MELTLNQGELLKTLRKDAGLTQKDLAKQLKIGQSTIVGYEKGLHEATAEILSRYANFFGISIDFLCGLENDFGGKSYTREKETPISSNDRLFIPSQLPADEDELLRLFRTLPPDYKNLALSTLRTWTGGSAHVLEKKNKA